MRKRIAVIGLKGLPAFGGAATVGENIIEKLKDKYDFTVYSVASHTHLKTGNYRGYNQIVFKNFKKGNINTIIYYFKALYHCMFKSNYDLIHTHHISCSYIIPFLRLKYKVVSTAHANSENEDKWKKFGKAYFMVMNFLFFRFPNLKVAVSKSHAYNYREKFKTNVYYIPNGINKEVEVSTVELKYKDFILFAAGRIVGIKGAHTLIEALKLLNYKGKILIIGNLDHIPKYSEKLVQLSKGLDLEFIGLIKDKPLLMKYIKYAKLFVFPSFVEAMSMMLLEVASLNTPIVSSDIVENKDIFDNDEVLFFRTGDIKDLSEKIKYALDNKSEMISKAQAASLKLKTDYTWDKIAKKYDNLYNELLQRVGKKKYEIRINNSG